MTQRIHGLQHPLSRDQIVALVVHPFLILSFIALLVVFVEKHTLAISLTFVALTLLLLFFWVMCETVDPVVERISLLDDMCCFHKKAAKSVDHYCSYCKKTIPGLDHHCSWLNTCIGKYNYAYFYCLSMVGFFLFTLQTGVCVGLVTIWRGNYQLVKVNSEAGYYVLMVVLILANAFMMMCYFCLFSFHTYLVIIGKGTFTWMLDKRNKKLLDEQRNAKGKSLRGKLKRNKVGVETEHDHPEDLGPTINPGAQPNGQASGVHVPEQMHNDLSVTKKTNLPPLPPRPAPSVAPASHEHHVVDINTETPNSVE